MVNGQQWLKLGWSAYDAKLGYGWAGPNIGNPKIMLYQYVAGAPNELQASVMYDDYGRMAKECEAYAALKAATDGR